MGFLAAIILTMFAWSLKKLTTREEIKARIILLIVGGIIFAIAFSVAATLSSSLDPIPDDMSFWECVLHSISLYCMIFLWRIITDFISYYKMSPQKIKPDKRKKDISIIKDEQLHEISDNSSLDELLLVSGKLFFIKYYSQLKDWQEYDIYDIIEEKYDEKTIKNRVSAGKLIFKKDLNLIALRSIISDPTTTSFEAINKAREILKSESNNESLHYAKIVKADTHAEFLNTVFNCGFERYYKSICWYSKKDNFAIWMIRLYQNNEDNWQNRLIKQNDGIYVSEKYIGEASNPLWNGKPVTLENLVGKRRLIVSIDDRTESREYRILGVFDLCDCSTDLTRLYKKLPDETAKQLIPEAF